MGERPDAAVLWVRFVTSSAFTSPPRRTPAMQAGIADHIQSVRELLESARTNYHGHMRVLKAVIAATMAGIATVFLFAIVGGFLPMLAMEAVYGRQALEDAPAHGGVILFATLPIAGLISIPVFLFLTSSWYRKLNRR